MEVNSVKHVMGDSNSSKLRRKLESEDSNYDSDHDRSPAAAAAAASAAVSFLPPLPQQPPLPPSKASSVHPHGDVSRQTSETLAAEFSEYVTVQAATAPTPPDLDTSDDLVMDQDYKNKVLAYGLIKIII